MKNRLRNGYLILILIMATYLCTVLSSYHVINYLALLLGLTLITSIYRTFDPLIKTKLKVKQNRVAAKINRDIVVYNKVSALVNIEQVLNSSDLVNDTVKLSSILYQGDLDIKLKKKVILFELSRLDSEESRLSLLRDIFRKTRVLDFDAFVSSFYVRPFFFKNYRYDMSSDDLLNRVWVLKSIVIGTLGAEKREIDLAIKYYLQKRDILVKINTLLKNNKKKDIISLIYELWLVELSCDFESLESKYFKKWNFLLNKKKGIYKCLYFIASNREIKHSND